MQICAMSPEEHKLIIVRLLDFRTQEAYYNRIVDRYMQFCATAGRSVALDQAFATLAIQDGRPNDATPFFHAPHNSMESTHMPQISRELSTIMLAMRKTREAIVATSRTDSFALRAYLFIIRATILTKHMESYHPALLHLLRNIHPSSALSASEQHEFVGYHILDVACRQGDLAAAYELRNKYHYKDTRVETVLHALVHDNWFMFWRVERLVDGYQKRLMEWSNDSMRKHALKCLGKSYLSAEKAYVEKVAERDWEQLKKKDSVGWELNGEIVTIRRVKRNNPSRPSI